MAVEAYKPESPDAVCLDGKPLPETIMVTLYDPDGDEPTGSVTTESPPSVGLKGTFTFQGNRDGKLWSVSIAQVTILNQTAVGSEFACADRPNRVLVRELGEEVRPHEKGFEEQFDIR